MESTFLIVIMGISFAFAISCITIWALAKIKTIKINARKSNDNGTMKINDSKSDDNGIIKNDLDRI